MNPSIDLKGLAGFIGEKALQHAEKKSGIAGLGEIAKPLVNGLIEKLGVSSFELDPVTYAMGRLAFMGYQAQQTRTAEAQARLQSEKEKQE